MWGTLFGKKFSPQKNVPLFSLQRVLVQVNTHDRAAVGRGRGRDAVPETRADTPAEVKPQPARFFIGPAVVAGVALFKNAGEILGGDADAGVGNAKRPGLLQIDADAALAGVFERIGEKLLQHKAKPFFVCDHLQVHRCVIQPELPADEFSRKFSDGRADDAVELLLPDDVIGGGGVQPQKGQHHLHILLDAEQVGVQPAGERGILVLQGQAHGGNRRFDLVYPYRVVVHHVIVAAVHGGLQRRLFLLQVPDDGLIIGVLQPVGVGKAGHRFGGELCKPDERTVPPADAPEVIERKAQQEQRAEQRGVEHGPHRQVIEQKRNAENDAEQRKHQKPAAVLMQIAEKQLHILLLIPQCSRRRTGWR